MEKTVHMPPHLHEAIEVVYVTNGNIALGVGMELYNMDEGDFDSVSECNTPLSGF